MKVILASAAMLALAAQSATITPGNWETTVVLTDISLSPDAPPEIAQAMQATMGGEGMTSQSCVTQEEIDEGPESIFGGAGNDCEYGDFHMANGMVHGSAVCDGSMNIEMHGTYTATSYAMTVTADGDMGEGMGPMSLSMSIDGQRVGDCGS